MALDKPVLVRTPTARKAVDKRRIRGRAKELHKAVKEQATFVGVIPLQSAHFAVRESRKARKQTVLRQQ